jgi:enterochelin esterase-like enzyme
MKINRLLILILSAAVASGQQTVSTGKLDHYDNFKSDLAAPRNVDVWLPDGYSKKEKYGVLYMHDGQMLFDGETTWNKQEWKVDETAGKLIADGNTKKFIVVGISSISAIRHSDYFPQKPFESLPVKQQDSLYALGRDSGQPLFGTKINSDNYLKFIVTELKPFIDKTYSVKTDRANTFIAGSSMGGLISMYAICEYPEVFGGAACISTHWPGTFAAEKNPIPNAFFDYMRTKIPSAKTHKFYFDLGDQTLDAMYGPFVNPVNVLFVLDHGYKLKKNYTLRVYPGADHSEKSWAERLDDPLLFLLGN